MRPQLLIELSFILVFNLEYKLVFYSSAILNTKPANLYLLVIKNRKRYEICLKLTIKTPEQGH